MTRNRFKSSKDKFNAGAKTSDNKQTQNRFPSDHQSRRPKSRNDNGHVNFEGQQTASNAENHHHQIPDQVILDEQTPQESSSIQVNNNSTNISAPQASLPMKQVQSSDTSFQFPDDSQNVELSSIMNMIDNESKLSIDEHQKINSTNQSLTEETNTQQQPTQQLPEPVQESSTNQPSNSKIDDLSNIEPPRLTKPVTTNGTHVYIAGTAHFSQDSVNDVSRIIRSIKPQAIVVELCRERMALLTLDDNEHMEGNKNFSMNSLPSLISKQGVAQGLIHAFFLKMSSALTNKLDVSPGGEFRVALAESKNIPGCTIYLGDRSIQVTIARAVNSLTFWEKTKFLYQALSIDSFQITQEEIEKFKSKDILQTLIEELGDEFEGIKSVILDERDIYLAHSIHGIAERYASIYKESNVVAVVGIGHVNGIVEHWGKTTDEQVCLISEIPEPSRTKIVVFKIVKYSFLGLCCYGLYKGFNSTFNRIHGSFSS